MVRNEKIKRPVQQLSMGATDIAYWLKYIVLFIQLNLIDRKLSLTIDQIYSLHL
jgi:hypothetical protein